MHARVEAHRQSAESWSIEREIQLLNQGPENRALASSVASGQPASTKIRQSALTEFGIWSEHWVSKRPCSPHCKRLNASPQWRFERCDVKDQTHGRSLARSASIWSVAAMGAATDNYVVVELRYHANPEIDQHVIPETYQRGQGQIVAPRAWLQTDYPFGSNLTLDYFPHIDHTQVFEEDRNELVTVISQRLDATYK